MEFYKGTNNNEMEETTPLEIEEVFNSDPILDNYEKEKDNRKTKNKP